MKIVLPLPISDNRRLIINWRAKRLILSTEYRKYREEAKQSLMIQLQKDENRHLFPMEITYEDQRKMVFMFYMKDKRRDASDCLKSLLDVMSGIIYFDDKWILPTFQSISIDKENPRVEIII